MFRIAFVGAGSVSFTRKLIGDILSVPEFHDVELALMDINEQNLEMVRQIVDRDVQANQLSSIRICATTDRREALAGARYVFFTARVGGLEAFVSDIDIPLRYGIDQCVGDTLGPGGLMYGQRGIPVILDLCADIREVSSPDCRLFNYANPMAMLTWAAIDYGGVETIGLCHGVQHTHRQIAGAFGIDWRELEYTAAGINHQTWFIELNHHGKDLRPELLATLENDPVLREEEKVRIDMLRRFGLYSTESNGHLSEYLAWYRKRPSEIMNWISLNRWIHGETGGYLRLCLERRNWFKEDFPKWLNEPPMHYDPDSRSVEHGSYILEGLETGRVYRGHFNVKNRGIIPNLPSDAIVEVPCCADQHGIGVTSLESLPPGCAAVLNQSISVQRLGVNAAVAGDDLLLRQAMLLDPLTGAVADPPEVWQMTDDLLIAGREWLPQYENAIEAAEIRLESNERIPTSEWTGAARRRRREVDELRANEAADEVMKTEEQTAHRKERP